MSWSTHYKKHKDTGLKVTAKKPSVTTSQNYKIVLLEWDDCGENYLQQVSFSGNRDDVQIHVFLNKTESKDKYDYVRRAFGDFGIFHESLTDCKDAPWTDLLAYLINFYTKVMVSCHHCAVVHPKPIYHVTLVARDEGKYSELKALLKSNKTQTRIVDGWKTTLLDLFPHVCAECKIIFTDEIEAELHDKEEHNYLCRNKSCERSRRENGFFSGKELTKHQRKQQKCAFCEDKVYCDVMKYSNHMQRHHIFCDCTCGQYYKNFEEFIAHYGGVYPLPCLESPECEIRFKNIDEQAFHHKTIHGSAYPYYCIACYGIRKLVCLRTSEELLSHVTEVSHKEKDFEIVIIPDLQNNNNNNDNKNGGNDTTEDSG